MPRSSSTLAAQPCPDGLCSQNCQFFLNKVSAEVDELKKTTKDMFAGVCLDCFKADGKFDGECRIKHGK